MKHPLNHSPISEEQLDRLVDGELDESERQALLAALEGPPDGWRRCAAAFLEAQAWRQALGEHARAVTKQTTAPMPPRKTFAWQQLLAVAASFLLAFGISIWWQNRAQTPVIAPPLVASNPSPNPPVPATVAEAPLARSVRLSVTDGESGEPQYIDVPVVDDELQIQQVLNDRTQILPPSVKQALHRLGHQVQQHRQLWPVQLQDGRQIVVPVDQVEVRYVGNRGVQ